MKEVCLCMSAHSPVKTARVVREDDLCTHEQRCFSFVVHKFPRDCHGSCCHSLELISVNVRTVVYEFACEME